MLTSVLDIWTPSGSDEYALTQDLAAMADTIEQAILNPPRIRLTSGTDVTLASTSHAYQVGPSNGSNMAGDDNEFQSRNNGAAAPLYLNPDGGAVLFGNADSVVTAIGGFQEGWNVIASGTNLNSVVRGGRYLASTATATYGNNFPVERSGVLEVISSAWAGATDGLRVQRYTSNAIPMTWVRWWSSSNGWSAWTNISPIKGYYDFSGLSANVTSSQTITFPSGAFQSMPSVSLTAGTTVPHNVFVGASDVSASGFTINVRRTDNTSTVRVYWSAV